MLTTSITSLFVLSEVFLTNGKELLWSWHNIQNDV